LRVGSDPRRSVRDTLVDGADGDAIAAALRRLLGDPAFRDRLAEGGIRHARALGWDQSARKFLEAMA